MGRNIFSHATISESLSREKFGHPLYFYRSIDSTNNEAKILASKGAPEGTLVVADEQTAGRGRFNRRWFTPKGSGLAVSLILRSKLSKDHISHISILGSLATAYAIEHLCNASLKLKWPNDIWINQTKIAGVLVETSYNIEVPEWLVLGIGINVNAKPSELTNSSYPVSFLANITGHKVDRVNLLQQLVRNVGILYNQLGQNSIIEKWEERMLWKGQHVAVIDSGNNATEGIVLGLAPNGSLLIQLPNGKKSEIYSGEIRLI